MGAFQRMGFLMNELYEKTIEVDGKIYRYDPDFDCFYRSHTQPPLTLKERLIQISVALALLALLITFANIYFK